MAKLPDLEHVKYVRTKGRLYAYFNTGAKRNGKPIYARLPDPSTPGFYDSYASMKGARTKRAAVGYALADMAKEYELSTTFKALSKNTQEIYSKTLRRITALLGKWPVATLEREHIVPVLDKEMAGPGAHNIFVAVLGTLYKWGAERGKTDKSPAKGIPKLKTEPHEPWPEHVLEAALASDDETIRLAVHLLYFTGQRIGDALKMRWSDVRNGTVHVVQEKTGKELWIAMAAELRDVLAETPKRGMTILAGANGKPMSQDGLRLKLQAFTAALGHKTVPHGLRKNAVNALLEAGCSVAEVASITGQTYQIVEHYARRINQKHMSEAAVLKLENRRGTGKQAGKP